MDLKATRRIENICGIIVIACVFVIASIEMNSIMKCFQIILLCLTYTIVMLRNAHNRHLKSLEGK